jgi:obg-like ATPase 1
MPPKKEEVKKLPLGRPGNTLKMGIVGVPNVGKSSTFNLLSKLSVPAENYPFCTKDPNKAKVYIKDARFDKLVSIFKPKSAVEATIEVVDIAGLVKGASEGAGLGNAFLSNIQAVDGIYHVVRGFDDEEIIHTEGEVDPVRDLEVISEELMKKDQQFLEKRLDTVEKDIARFNSKQAKEEKETLDKVKALFDKGIWVKDGTWSAKDIEILNEHLFLTAKPVIYMVNLSEKDFKRKGNKWLPKIKEWVDKACPGPIIPYSVTYEQALLEKSEKEEETKAEDDSKKPTDANLSMVPKITKTGYKMLDLIHYFTAGEDEVKCWTVRDGTKAPQAAGVIHTDFEKGFICAEVMKYEDFIEFGSETEVKSKGKLKTQGKEYIVCDGDIMHFKFNAPSSKK